MEMVYLEKNNFIHKSFLQKYIVPKKSFEIISSKFMLNCLLKFENDFEIFQKVAETGFGSVAENKTENHSISKGQQEFPVEK